MRFCRLRSFAYQICYAIFKNLLDKYKMLWYNPVKNKKGDIYSLEEYGWK